MKSAQLVRQTVAGLWLLLCAPGIHACAQTVAPASAPVTRFALRKSGLELERPTRAGVFFDVAGRRAAVFGYEHRPLEAWVYPMKLLDNFELAFNIEGYPLPFSTADTAVRVSVRPEATTFTYSHAAFTVRQTIFAPIEEPGVVMLLDIESALPMTVTASFRPRLRLSWPAGLMTGNLGWDDKAHVYYLTEETNRYVGVVGSPAARDISVMPYQEEPRDAPARFVVEVSAEAAKTSFVPIVIAGGVEGREKAKAAYDRLLNSARQLYEQNVAHYERLQRETLSLTTPDERLNTAFAWAKVGVDKGVVTNPLLGTGLVAGYRTSGESERPGFAWFFGRDSLWTALALNSAGDFRATRDALAFLKKFQRADGKIPHEISQSASLIPWFTDYPFPWASADATPLYVITHADYWRTSGDRKFLQDNWESITKAYRFTEATDTDANGLVENTKFGHGWVEGGALYPPHEEIYQQGVWIEASRNLAEMAEALNDSEWKTRALQHAERARAAMEQTYWLPQRGFYAYATKRATPEAPVAEPGPNRARRQARLNELKDATLYDEDTVLPAVPLWWGTMQDERAQLEIDHLGSGALATDWGARIISNESRLYDPLSYHYGSVWPLFTGWASMGAYRHGRPHVGYQALMANALLTFQGALGSVTELLSGDFNAPFGRSSHHQIWSEAMVITPAARGLLGLEVTGGGAALRFAPQLPAHWERVEVRNVAAGQSRYDLRLTRARERLSITATRSAPPSSPSGQTAGQPSTLIAAPSFPLDARVRGVTVKGRPAQFKLTRVGDTQRAEVTLTVEAPETEIVFTYTPGTDVYYAPTTPLPGARNQGLRILRSVADATALRLTLEGLAGRSYELRARTPRRLGQAAGVTITDDGDGDPRLYVSFDGPTPGVYIRRELVIPLQTPPRRRR